MTIKMLHRQKIGLILLLVIPAVFLSIVKITTSKRILPFRLASLNKEIYIKVAENGISFVFFAIASAGFLVSFLALNLIQKNYKVDRRLVICGYHPGEILCAKLLSLFAMILLIAVYVGLLTSTFFSIKHLSVFIFGLLLIGFVYGSYGLLVGSLIKGELEGILLIVLLVNIDAGWLQNPLFYAEAQNQVIIKFLPAYFPSQTAIIAAFTDYSSTTAILFSFLYGVIFLLISFAIFFFKMQIKNERK